MPRTGSQPKASAGWRSRDVLRVAALVAGVDLALKLLWVAHSIVFLAFLGVLFGLALAAGVDRLQRWRIPRGVGALLLVGAVGGALTGLGAVAAPKVTSQMRELRDQVPQVIQRVERWVEERQGGVAELLQQPDTTAPAASDSAGAEKSGGGGTIRRGLAGQLGGVGQHFFAVFSSTLAVIGGLVLITFIAIFVAIEPELYHAGLMHLFPHRTRARAGEVLSAVALTLRRWLTTQLILMVLIGTITTVVLLLLGVRAAVALGIIAGIFEFVPYLGPVISAVPAIAMALVDGPEKAIWVVVAYTVIQQLEGNVLTPMLMKEGLELPPVLTILGQAVMGLVFGFIGLLVAVPLLGAAMVPIKMLYVRDVVGDEVSLPGDPKEDDDAE